MLFKTDGMLKSKGLSTSFAADKVELRGAFCGFSRSSDHPITANLFRRAAGSPHLLRLGEMEIINKDAGCNMLRVPVILSQTGRRRSEGAVEGSRECRR
jgi:hypothetical protein